AEQPVGGGRVHHVRGVLARLVDPRRPLRDDLARELLDGGLEGLLDVCELENHKGEEWNAEPAELAEIIPVRVLCELCVQISFFDSRSKIGLSLITDAPKSSGSTRTLPTTV